MRTSSCGRTRSRASALNGEAGYGLRGRRMLARAALAHIQSLFCILNRPRILSTATAQLRLSLQLPPPE